MAVAAQRRLVGRGQNRGERVETEQSSGGAHQGGRGEVLRSGGRSQKKYTEGTGHDTGRV